MSLRSRPPVARHHPSNESLRSRPPVARHHPSNESLRSRRLAAAALAPILVALGTVGPAAAADQEVLLKIKDSRITESSGLAASTLHPDVYWTHNDSDDGAKLYAIGKDGGTVATITLQGVQARDWEAIAIGKDDNGRPALYVGDIGDNLHGAWDEVYIYRITEPETLADATVKPVKYRVKYADGARDAESMLIDPRTNKVYIASKEDKAGLYEQPDTLSATGVNTFRRVASAPSMLTDGAFSPDGSRFVLRGYFNATVFSAPGQEVGGVDVPLQRQGESVTWSADGRAILFGSEGGSSQVWRVALSGDVRPDSVRAAGGDGGATSPAASDGGGDGLPMKAIATGAGVVLVAALLLVGYRRLGRR